MGQKVNSNGLRVGINKNWQSRWIARSNAQVGDWLVQDEKVRKLLLKDYHAAEISNIEIERTRSKNDDLIHVLVYASQPAIVLGKDNANIKDIIKKINKIVGRNTKVDISINEVKNPALSARIVARQIADNLEHRVPLRTAMRNALKQVLKAGGHGIKVLVSGRLNGVEIARDKMYIEGNVPLSTLRSDIDYALEQAHMSYGVIGVKVWINRGVLFGKELERKQAHLIANPNVRSHREGSSHKEQRDNVPSNKSSETMIITSQEVKE